MAKQDRPFLIRCSGGKDARKNRKQGTAEKIKGRYHSDCYIGSAEALQEKRQEGGIDHQRKAQTPCEFHGGNAEDISRENPFFRGGYGFIVHCFTCKLYLGIYERDITTLFISGEGGNGISILFLWND